jgi:DNA-binding response OmpR family regulator
MTGTCPLQQEALDFFTKPPLKFQFEPRAGGLLRMFKVLIVEDDLMLADFAEEILVARGYEVSGIARTVAEAVALARHSRPDLVILDLRLADGGLGTEVAAQLASLGRPGILYVTGNMSQVALTNGDACLAKPYRTADLLRGLEIVAEIVATGKAQPPFPQGFQLLHPAADSEEALL